MTQKLLDLFRAPHNMDTMQIAELLGGPDLGWTEAKVYRILNAERREERTPLTWADVKPKNSRTRKKSKNYDYDSIRAYNRLYYLMVTKPKLEQARGKA